MNLYECYFPSASLRENFAESMLYMYNDLFKFYSGLELAQQICARCTDWERSAVEYPVIIDRHPSAPWDAMGTEGGYDTLCQSMCRILYTSHGWRFSVLFCPPFVEYLLSASLMQPPLTEYFSPSCVSLAFHFYWLLMDTNSPRGTLRSLVTSAFATQNGSV